MRSLCLAFLPLCAGSILGGLFPSAGQGAGVDPGRAAAIAAGDYGVDVSTMIHGRLDRNTFQVRAASSSSVVPTVTVMFADRSAGPPVLHYDGKVRSEILYARVRKY